MKCPKCGSEHIRKNGIKKGKQNHICAECGRQFINPSEQTKSYSESTKQTCLEMYLNGMGFRAIERVMGVHHTTVIHWVRQKGEKLSDSIEPKFVPDVEELDKLETFVDSKKQNLAVDSSSSFL
jgi:transposase-like protein